MKSILRAALPVCSLLLGSYAFAQDEGTPPLGDPALIEEAPRSLLGLDLPENHERQNALYLQNFLAMDLNGDYILAPSEWESWSGWRGSPPPVFEGVDANSSTYIGYREYEDAALALGDSRLGDALHGAVFPDEDVAE